MPSGVEHSTRWGDYKAPGGAWYGNNDMPTAAPSAPAGMSALPGPLATLQNFAIPPQLAQQIMQGLPQLSRPLEQMLQGPPPQQQPPAQPYSGVDPYGRVAQSWVPPPAQPPGFQFPPQPPAQPSPQSPAQPQPPPPPHGGSQSPSIPDVLNDIPFQPMVEAMRHYFPQYTPPGPFEFLMNMIQRFGGGVPGEGLGGGGGMGLGGNASGGPGLGGMFGTQGGPSGAGITGGVGIF